jgi:hypothetical protein
VWLLLARQRLPTRRVPRGYQCCSVQLMRFKLPLQLTALLILLIRTGDLQVGFHPRVTAAR